MFNNIRVQENNKNYENSRTVIRISTTIFIFVVLSFAVYLSLIPSAMADTGIQDGGEDVSTLGNFLYSVLDFLIALLWGAWTIVAVLFARDLMLGKDAAELKRKIFKLIKATIILLIITALPVLFADFAN